MTIEISLLLSGVSVAFAIFFGICSKQRNEKKDTQEDAEQRATTDTMVMVKLENIADDLKDIKRESRENREEMKTLRERVVIVEQSLKASNYDPAQITIACEADCSSGVAAIVKGAGYRLGNEKMKNVSIYLYTGNMRAGLKAAGFEVLTDSKYLTSDAYLLEGDILLNDNAHVATNLTDGAKSSGTGASNTTPVKSNTKVDVAHGFNKSLAGTYKVTASGLNLRAGAGTGKSILAVMKNGEKVQCYGYYNDCNGVKWLYVVYKNIVGYASSKYLSK